MADVIKVTLVNRVPNSVTVSTGVSGGGTWGTISGTITDQSDLVTYVTSERPNYPVVSPDGTSFIIVAGNDGTLAAIPPTSTAPSITTLPTISGTLNVGETLTATAGTTSGVPTPTRVLQWQRSDNGTTGWADISGATGTTYLLAFNDEDKYIRVAQTEENILGTATANSVSTTQIQPSTGLLLDQYTGAAAAYSLRKLSLIYSGDAIIVRRASDNATQSIGFLSNGELDTSSLESFCAGTDGFVTTWYDQSGNGVDAAQTIAGAQPKIVSSGSTILDNSKPCVQFDGIANSIVTSSNFIAITDLSLFVLRKFNFLQPRPQDIISQGATASSQGFKYGMSGGAQDQLVIYYSSSYAATDGTTTINQELHSLITTSSTTTLNINAAGQALSVSSGRQIGNNNDPLTIGKRDSGGGFFNGNIQELVIYTADKSTDESGIEININDFYNIY